MASRPFERYDVCEPYLMTRIKALRMPPAVINMKMTDDKQVYSAVIDIPMGNNLLGTLVCLGNGAVNLYFNNGASITGLASRHPSLAQAARTFTSSAGQAISVCERTSVFDLPVNATAHYVHLMTRKGVYKTVIDPSKLKPLDEDDKKKIFLMHLYQIVMNEIRDAQAKESAK